MDIYSQKHIYEIALTPNALKERIDSAIPEINNLQNDKEELNKQYMSISAKIREYEQKLANKDKLKAELSEKEMQIKLFKESGMEDLINKSQLFSSDNEIINSIRNTFIEKIALTDKFIEELSDYQISSDKLSDIHKDELTAIISNAKKNMTDIISAAKDLKSQLESGGKTFSENLENSNWNNSYKANQNYIENKKSEFIEKGFENINDFERLLSEKNKLKQQLFDLTKIDKVIENLNNEKSNIFNKILEKSKDISETRKEFLLNILEGHNIQIDVKSFRDKKYYEDMLRDIIKRSSGFESEIDNIIKKCFHGKFPETLFGIHSDLDNLRNDKMVEGYDGNFKNLIKNLEPEQFDKLKILLPEDEVTAKYKLPDEDSFKSISNASAGQKTSSILTFILSHGKTPLILDQPEDDLDNHLVYGLIVDRLKNSKENRQIIVVTHNANIPVNGDSEYIFAMDSESSFLRIGIEGTLEEEAIKKEICDVMEGGKSAFKLRRKRYEGINN